MEHNMSELARQMAEYLDCPCEVFPPMEDDDPLTQAYQAAVVQGRKEGFTPMLIKVDETLWECLLMNADEQGGEAGEFSLERVRSYRSKVLAAELPDGESYLKAELDGRREEYEEDGIDWDAQLLGEPRDGEPNDRLAGYWNYSTCLTDEVILAKIPVREPWNVFAWLPMGGWNDCPDTLTLMAVSRRWYEQYGAVPACVSHDELEFLLAEPVQTLEQAQCLALEQYAFCPDRVEQCEEDGSIGKLADSLTKSDVWYFWWD